jgi:PLP dependent protein
MNIKYNINNLIQNLPPGCKLVAVSKTQSIGNIMEAYDAGQRIFGENKVQELVQKESDLPDDIQWHMIGHLQRNKVKNIVPFVTLIHSVDSEKLLKEIDIQGGKISRVVPCLLQVHIADEETKFGFATHEVIELLNRESIGSLSNIMICGLMGMATLTDDQMKIRREFRNLKSLLDELKKSPKPGNVRLEELSMGMSNDYKIAVEEGSTLVRIGSAIFGERISH